MAGMLGRIGRSSLLKPNYGPFYVQANNYTGTKDWFRRPKPFLAAVGASIAGVGLLIYALEKSVQASEFTAHPPTYKWNFYGWLSSLDHRSVRRGWEVYKNVCSACHSLNYVAYRQLVNVSHTEAEAKALAAEIEVRDGPDDEGNYYMRPGTLIDYIKAPYPNEQAARAANNGAYPPDLSLIARARENGENYIFSLLTGYCDKPAGVELGEGQYFNPYFPGGGISMAQVIFDEVVEFEDGTPATASQVAKDVVQFLVWTANPEFDERKLVFIKFMIIFGVLMLITFYYKRHKFTTLKSGKLAYVPRKK